MRAAIVAAVAIGAAYAIKRAAEISAQSANEATGETDIDYPTTWGLIDMKMQQHTTATAMQDANVRAFLAAIAWAEGTDRAADPYRVCYAYKHTIRDLADHPANSGEWSGEPLTPQQCAGAGHGPGCVSTAAGRYQIIRPTWNAARRALGLIDFGPDSQDRAAVWLIDRRDALDAVKRGDVREAMTLCKTEWASLPGANYAGQSMRTESDLVAVFERAGGFTA